MKLSLFGFSRSLGAMLTLCLIPVLYVYDRAYDLGVALAGLARDVFTVAFDPRAAVERTGLPSLVRTNATVTSIGAARTDSFVTRRSARTLVGRGSGDPCTSLAFAA